MSIAVHAALVLALTVGAGQAMLRPSETTSESIISSALRYLLPPDRPGRPAAEAQATWSSARPAALPPGNPETYSPQVEQAGTPTPDVEDSAAPEPLAEAAAAQNAFTLLDVDTAAVRDPSSAVPVYPSLLEKQGIEGTAVVRFVVDTNGRADLGTFRLVETNHPLFAAAVRDALPGMKFHPATVGPNRVRQMVELPFGFQIVRRGAANPPRKPDI
ncbi:MAG: energy transducer TonB [Gemmatimonadaceae bacterium]|nr:energy transducer TonB [Gemmatimonadaceae bacterium]